MKVVAKPVVANKFWILRKNEEKIGEVENSSDGIQVRVGGKTLHYKTLHLLKKKSEIEFTALPKKNNPGKPGKEVHGYPVDSSVFNPVFDVKQKLPLYTKKKNSKSWFAAGWYQIRQSSKWKTIFCPKLIALKRYEYRGPYISDQNIPE